MKKNTPWGYSQHTEKLANGITFHHCSGHGGIELSVERQMMLNYKDNFLKNQTWWEEDCDWAIPFYFFRNDIFQKYATQDMIEHAKQTVIRWNPDFAKREGII